MRGRQKPVRAKGTERRRFNIEYPVLVQYLTGETTVEVEAVTKNESIGGILMTSDIILLHTPVSLRLRIQREEGVRCRHLAGEGKIVRVERIKNKGVVAIAEECNVPLNHLEENVVSYPTGYN